ncbi:signal peptidase complex subunit 1 [Sitophilus oryzae]|uniref:Signal peptidase complex subunit 1 n=1 Tax=Sitophilus oryzae TaxID=7048 RepID=A0A6J2X7K9_SITOR|nr:signal peptidase complex subunit 1 [Sitophilus oryzae]
MDFFKTIPLHMDFEGQHRAEKLSRIIITVFGLVGLVWGYIIQQFSQTVYILAAGFLLTSILTIPPWPMYRKKPLKWQPARDIDSNSKDSNKGKKKK